MKKILILFLSVTVSMVLFAQEPGTVQRSEIIEKLDGKEYYIHLVRHGENLQNIASAYQVSITVINKDNPRFNGLIGPGDVIKIPKHTTATPPKILQAEFDAADPASITHIVIARETFFGIARQYNITVADLQAANPNITSLQPGHGLRIPTKQTTITPTQAPRPRHTPAAPINQTEQVKHPDQIPDTYTVQIGETLFSISRKFGLTVDELKALNPELIDGLKAGKTIRLRKQKINVDSQYIIVQDTTVSYTYHRVRRGETLFGLSRKYGIGEEDILENNPHALDGLQSRQILKIPVYGIRTRKLYRAIKPVELVEIPVDTVQQPIPDDCQPLADPERVYNIAFMLPFFLDTQDEIIQTDSIVTVIEADPNRYFEFMQFYYGAMLAIDKLREKGLNANVFVYDVDNTPESVFRVLEEPALPSMDMIIGPVYANSFDMVAAFAREHHISIVNPLSSRNEFLLNNPLAIKAQPTAKNQVNLIAPFINNYLPGHNIVIVRQFSFIETETLDVLRSAFSERQFHEVIFIRDSLDGIIRHLDSIQDNIVIGLSTDKVFSMDLVRKLSDIRSDFPITCFGLQEWEEFSLDTEHIVNLHLHLPSGSFIDYDAEPVKQFIRSFREKYNIEPIPKRFAFVAFDLTWYFVHALMKYGEAFDACLPAYKYRGLQLAFSFEAQGRHGMENKGLTIYRIQDFRKVGVWPGL